MPPSTRFGRRLDPRQQRNEQRSQHNSGQCTDARSIYRISEPQNPMGNRHKRNSNNQNPLLPLRQHTSLRCVRVRCLQCAQRAHPEQAAGLPVTTGEPTPRVLGRQLPPPPPPKGGLRPTLSWGGSWPPEPRSRTWVRLRPSVRADRPTSVEKDHYQPQKPKHTHRRTKYPPPPRVQEPPCARTNPWFRGQILASLFFTRVVGFSWFW